MGGEKKAFLFLSMLVVVGITVIFSLLFVSLWQYRVEVGVSLLLLLAVLVAVFVRGRLVEQQLRQVRYRHYEETPLDVYGEPYYWHQGMQENPYRVPGQMQQGYHGQEWE